MKKTIINISFILFAIGTFTITSCVKDPKPAPVVEQEEFDHALIQLIKLKADGSETTDTTTINFDKTGTPTPTQTSLVNQTSYRMLITLSSNGASINNEIIEEGVEHKFFLNPSVSGVFNYAYNDADTAGNGIGLDGKLSTLQANAGMNLKVILRHALDKNNAAAQEWNSTTYSEAGGEDDLNITFGVKVE